MTHAQRREIGETAEDRDPDLPVDDMDGEDDSFQDELAPGTQLLQGQYEITRFLNAGGFGITYLAKDSLERQVVIKECFPGAFCRRSRTIVSPRSRAHQNEFRKIVRLFVQEARSLAKLRHPNIVGVHQVFEDNDTAYMAIDFVDGQDLLDIVDAGDPDGLLTPDSVTRMLRKLIDAVGFVHSQGMLHRDISPDNVLLDRAGEPILIDFGAAREQATKKSRVLSAIRVVKDGYSPQEFYIQGAKQGDFSDLYALGATFHHVIAGEAPPDSQLRLTRIAEGGSDPYQPLAGRVEGFAPGVLASIDKALMVLPKDRIQKAADWLALIDAAPAVAAAGGAAAGGAGLLDAVEAILVPGEEPAEEPQSVPMAAAEPAPAPVVMPADAEPEFEPEPVFEAREESWTAEEAGAAEFAEPAPVPVRFEAAEDPAAQMEDFRARAARRAAPLGHERPRRAAKGRGTLLLAGCGVLALVAGGALWTIGGEDLIRGSSRVTVNVGTGATRTQQVPTIDPGGVADRLIRRAPVDAAPQTDARAAPEAPKAAAEDGASAVAQSEPARTAAPAAAAPAPVIADAVPTSAAIGEDSARTAAVAAAPGAVRRAVPQPGAGVRPKARPDRVVLAAAAPSVDAGFAVTPPAAESAAASAAAASAERPAPIATARIGAPAAPAALPPARAADAAPASAEVSAAAASRSPDALGITQTVSAMAVPPEEPGTLAAAMPVPVTAPGKVKGPAGIEAAAPAGRTPGSPEPLPQPPAAQPSAQPGASMAAAPGAAPDAAPAAPGAASADAPTRTEIAGLAAPAGTDGAARSEAAPEPLPEPVPDVVADAAADTGTGAGTGADAPVILFGDDSAILFGDAVPAGESAVSGEPAPDAVAGTAPEAPAPAEESFDVAAAPAPVTAPAPVPAPAEAPASASEAPALGGGDGLFMIVDDAAPVDAGGAAPEGLRVLSESWAVRPPFSTVPTVVDGVVHHAIAGVSEGDPQLALNRWVAPGLVIYAVDGELVDARSDFASAFAELARMGSDGMLGAELLVEDTASGRLRSVDLRLDARREVRLAAGMTVEFERLAGRWIARVTDAPAGSGLEAGDTLLEETATGLAFDGEDALAALGRRMAGGEGTARLVLLRGGERITVPVDFGAAG